jgi:hypothetical protein
MKHTKEQEGLRKHAKNLETYLTVSFVIFSFFFLERPFFLTLTFPVTGHQP